TDKPIQMHIAGGKVNGYLDLSNKRHDNVYWSKLLRESVSPIMDMKGTRVQLAYATETLKRLCPERGPELLQVYDDIIRHQHEIMGLDKYKMVPKNRMFGRVMWKGFMHADGMGAAFNDNTMDSLANPDKVKGSSWGIAHEFGHVNQVRPNMKWVGTGEVTNNIFSAWTQYQLTPNNLRLEGERCGGYDGGVIGGRYNSFLVSGVVKGQEWLTQAGPDRWERFNGKDWGGDHFVKLVPLWQLQLYFVVAGKGELGKGKGRANSWYCPDFYADIYHRAITRENTGQESDSFYQLEFMRNACDVTKSNLSSFFESVGMLKVVDKYVDDYRCAQLTITENDVMEFKRYARKYKQPASKVLHYLSANSVETYRLRLPLQGSKGKGVELRGKNLIVSGDFWKNVVAFETYAGKELTRAVIVGTNFADLSKTQVPYPEGSTSVVAVGWDGKRLLVYGE
ncbi:MAG: M60 family metallopeptidase, partial [Lentisphaeria bacterium]